MILGSLALAALAAAGPPTFAASVEGVYLDVLVSDGGRAVEGLTAADFEVRDNGARRPLYLLPADALPLRVSLVLDASASVSGAKLRQLQAAAAALLGRLAEHDEASLLTFGEEVRLRTPPSRDRQRVLEALASVEGGGATAVYDALYAAAMLAPQPGRSLVILFSDGEENLSWLEAGHVRQALLQSNLVLQVVGIVPEQAPAFESDLISGPPVREAPQVRVLRELAELTGGSFWPVSAPEGLDDAFVAILRSMQARYVLRLEPAPAREPGVHRLDVKLRKRKGRVRARKAYVIGPR